MTGKGELKETYFNKKDVDLNAYPFNLPFLINTDRISINPQVTYFVGKMDLVNLHFSKLLPLLVVLTRKAVLLILISAHASRIRHCTGTLPYPEERTGTQMAFF